MAAPERAAAGPYPPYTPYDWWLHAQVSRDAPPPLQGGYKVGEKVFYTGASKTLPSGDKYVQGQQGEVAGPATLERYQGFVVRYKGLVVHFPGNRGIVACWLTEVRRLRAASAATPRLCLTQCTRRCPRPVRSRGSLRCGAPALSA